jgi:hypothetical protein
MARALRAGLCLAVFRDGGRIVTAYLLSQIARVKMAASALAGTPEATRVLRDFRRYRRTLRWELERR